MKRSYKIFFIAAILSLGISGCVSSQKNMYYWGEYEKLIYEMYNQPGTADAVTQIQKITSDIQKAESQGLKVPPGVYAHLGFMYALQGNTAQSMDSFNEEKNLFPESSVLIDGMMSRAMNQGNNR